MLSTLLGRVPVRQNLLFVLSCSYEKLEPVDKPVDNSVYPVDNSANRRSALWITRFLKLLRGKLT